MCEKIGRVGLSFSQKLDQILSPRKQVVLAAIVAIALVVFNHLVYHGQIGEFNSLQKHLIVLGGTLLLFPPGFILNLKCMGPCMDKMFTGREM